MLEPNITDVVALCGRKYIPSKPVVVSALPKWDMRWRPHGTYHRLSVRSPCNITNPMPGLVFRMLNCASRWRCSSWPSRSSMCTGAKRIISTGRVPGGAVCQALGIVEGDLESLMDRVGRHKFCIQSITRR